MVLGKGLCIANLYILPRVNNIRREYLTSYRAVKYDCVKLKGFPCDVYIRAAINHAGGQRARTSIDNL